MEQICSNGRVKSSQMAMEELKAMEEQPFGNGRATSWHWKSREGKGKK